MWDVHKTVCILGRFLSAMSSSPAISLSLSHSHRHTHTHTHHTQFTTHFLWTCHWCDPAPREVSFGPGTSVVSLSDFWKNRCHLCHRLYVEFTESWGKNNFYIALYLIHLLRFLNLWLIAVNYAIRFVIPFTACISYIAKLLLKK